VLFGYNDIGRLSFVGDSVIGENTTTGSGLTTVNHTAEYSPVICKTGHGAVETGLIKLGAFFGDNVKIGVRHVTGPGSILNSGSKIPDSTTIRSAD